ncbi:MAG TPA: hypothetical protein VF169_09540 [Albitalea sp.]|uniref:hypothetical protein n=1 Tax=Piscinibacter sp. TaxID=1903157 RepID=UPI002ED4B617
MNAVRLALLLPFLLAFSVAGHAVVSRVVKAVLWAWSPLASGEPEAATYERRVYHTADRPMMEIVAAAAGAGLVLWLGVLTGWGLLWAAAFVALGGVVLLDVLRWERVAVSAHNLWFQRGFRSNVHQVALENIRDLSIDETEARGFTLRHGTRNRMVRLSVRMNDKRVVALPKTDAYNGMDGVEAVAAHLRMRLQQMRDREAARRAARNDDGTPVEALGEDTDELRRALRRLRVAKQRDLKSTPHER